jgi:hypothetical protein
LYFAAVANRSQSARLEHLNYAKGEIAFKTANIRWGAKHHSKMVYWMVHAVALEQLLPLLEYQNAKDMMLQFIMAVD